MLSFSVNVPHTHSQVNQLLPSFLPPKLGDGVFTGTCLPLATSPHLAHSRRHPFVSALAWAEDLAGLGAAYPG